MSALPEGTATGAERSAAALDARLAGTSWKEVAARFGYASAGSARSSVLRACADDAERERARTAWTRPLSTRRIDNGEGYLFVAVPRGHPLRTRGGNAAYEHRLVVYEQYGYGPVPCWRCRRPISWADLEAHHLDADRANNTPENVVPACGACNVQDALERKRKQDEEWPF